MSALYSDFYRVKCRAEGREKVAAEHAAGEQVALWTRLKLAAAGDADGLHVGLMKVALELWSDHGVATGEKTACSCDEREQWAASFASAAVVDDALGKMAMTGEITPIEYAKLATLNAESAMNDLFRLTKTANPGMFNQNPNGGEAPVAMPMSSGAPSAGAAPQGAPPGGDPSAQGGPPGAGDAMPNDGVASAAAQEEQAAKEFSKHMGNVEVLKHVAETTNNPGLRAELEQRGEEMLQHLADGNTSLPAWAQRHFATAAQAKHFADVVRQRTTPLFGGGGSKK